MITQSRPRSSKKRSTQDQSRAETPEDTVVHKKRRITLPSRDTESSASSDSDPVIR